MKWIGTTRLLPVAAVVLALAVPGFGIWYGIRRLTHRPPAAPRFETVARGDVENTIVETGTIEPLKKVEVKSKVAGRVARLYVEEGARVRSGQLLAEIDPTEINSQVEQIRAQVDGARARLALSQRSVVFQKSQTATSIRQFEQALRTAQARLKVAEAEHRIQPEVSESELAQARSTLTAARSRLRLLREVNHPQAVVQARTAYSDASTQEQNARRTLGRQRALLAQGYVARQDMETAAAQVATWSARCEQAKAALDRIAEQNTLEIRDAEAAIADAEAALARAQANQSRVGIRRDEVEAARAAVAQAQAQLDGARAGVEQDRMRQDEVAAARATVAQLDQQLQEVRVRQQDTRLVAPMDGVVSRRYIEADELVTSGVSTFSSGTPVMQIADLSVMLVQMTVNEVDVHQCRPGLPVEIEIDGARGRVFQGRVQQVAPASIGAAAAGGAAPAAPGGNSGVIRFAVKVRVDRPDLLMRPGMSARCAIVTSRRRGVLRVPEACVPAVGSEVDVTILTEPKTVRPGKPGEETRRVTLGLRGNGYVEILSGLNEGERVKPQPFTGPARQGLDLNGDD